MNQVQLLGRLTRDPELRYFEATNTARVRFILAVNKPLSRQKKQEFEQQGKPTADFIPCVAWGNRAETISQYVKKGDQFAVTGRIETGSYENDQGQTIWTTDVNIDGFDFISSNRQNNQGGFESSEAPFQEGGQGGYTSNKANEFFEDYGMAGDVVSAPDDNIPF